MKPNQNHLAGKVIPSTTCSLSSGSWLMHRPRSQIVKSPPLRLPRVQYPGRWLPYQCSMLLPHGICDSFPSSLDHVTLLVQCLQSSQFPSSPIFHFSLLQQGSYDIVLNIIRYPTMASDKQPSSSDNDKTNQSNNKPGAGQEMTEQMRKFLQDKKKQEDESLEEEKRWQDFRALIEDHKARRQRGYFQIATPFTYRGIHRKAKNAHRLVPSGILPPRFHPQWVPQFCNKNPNHKRLYRLSKTSRDCSRND